LAGVLQEGMGRKSMKKGRRKTRTSLFGTDIATVGKEGWNSRPMAAFYPERGKTCRHD